MKSELGKALRKVFDRELVRRLPMCRPVKPAEVEVPPGWRVYEYHAGKAVRMFIVLAIHSKENEFTIDLAWSKKGRFPSLLGYMAPVPDPQHGIERADSPIDGEFRFRLGSLMQPPQDRWWRLRAEPDAVDEMLEEFSPGRTEQVRSGGTPQEQVDGAITAIETYGIPYFESILGDS